MNLVTDSWIPVVWPDGVKDKVSLRDAFKRAAEIRDLSCNPPQRIALMRLLICIAQVGLDGPEDEEDWFKCKERLADVAMKYLDQKKDCFNLFGEHPFMQIPGLIVPARDKKGKKAKGKEEAKQAVLDKLDMRLATGSSAHTLFDHVAVAGPRSHEPENLALNLLTFQCFALSGGQSGQARWGNAIVDGSANIDEKKNKPRSNNNFMAAPCASSKLFTLLMGANLLDTIHLNLISRQDAQAAMPNVRWEKKNKPLWEDYPGSYKDKRATEHRQEYLGSLIPLSRFLRLDSTSKTHFPVMVNGYAYNDDPQTRRDPMLTVIANDEGELNYCRISPGRHPWRDLHSVLATQNRYGGAVAVRHLQTLAQESDTTVEVWTGGLLSDQGSPVEGLEWRFTIPLAILDSERLQLYQKGVTLAVRRESWLREACEAYFDLSGNKVFQRKANGEYEQRKKGARELRGKILAQISACYWARLDKCSDVLITARNETTDDSWREWLQVIRRTEEASYADSCPRQTARQVEAYARGLDKLKLDKPEE